MTRNRKTAENTVPKRKYYNWHSKSWMVQAIWNAIGKLFFLLIWFEVRLQLSKISI